jgi:hypothetical protein
MRFGKNTTKFVVIPYVAFIVSIHVQSVLTDDHIKNIEYVS